MIAPTKNGRLLRKIAEGDVDGVNQLLKDGANPNTRQKAKGGNLGASALLLAAKIGDMEVVKTLIDAGADRADAAELLRQIEWVPTTEAQHAYKVVMEKRWDDVPRLGSVAVAPLIAVLEECSFAECFEVLPGFAKTKDPRAFTAVRGLVAELEPPLTMLLEMHALACDSQLSIDYLLDQYLRRITTTARNAISDRAALEVFIIPLYKPLFDEIHGKNIDNKRSCVPLTALWPVVKPLVPLLFESLTTMQQILNSMDDAGNEDLREEFSEIEQRIVDAAKRLGAEEVSNDADESKQ